MKAETTMRPARWSATRSAAVGALLAASLAAGGALAQETTVRHGISAFGELKYAPDFEQFDYVNVDAPREGGVRVQPTSAARTFNSFNLFIIEGDPAPSTTLLFDSLMVRAFDEPDAVYGLVAESVEMPADRSFAVFRLRPEARFSDGSPLTAADVAWTVATLKDVGSPRFSTVLQAVEEITIIDEHTVRFDFADTAGRRDLPAYVATLPILSKAWFDTRSFTEPSLEPPLGSGPYRVGDFAPGDFVEYVRRDDYWAWDLPVVRGQFNFETINYIYFQDRDVALEAFFSGSFDFHEEFTSRAWATRYDVPAVNDGRIIRDTLPDGTPSGAQGWWFNTRLEKFSDPRVREALAMVYNFEQANRQQFYGIYNRVRSPFENSDLVAEGEPSPEETALLSSIEGAPEAALGPVPTPPVFESDEIDRRTRRRALALLREAGWEIDPSDGVLKNAAGEIFEIEFLDRAGSDFERIVAPFIANLEELGVRAAYRQVDVTSYQERIREFDFDMVTARYVFPATPGPSVRAVFHSDGANQPDSPNLAGIDSPAIDATILAMEQATSRDEMLAAARAFDRVFRASHFWVPHWYKASHNVAYWDRFGRPQDLGVPKPPYSRAVLLTWWIDPERAARLDAGE